VPQTRIDPSIDTEVDRLIFSAMDLFDRAEKLLSDRYKTARESGDHVNQEYVLQKLAYFYSLKRDYVSAEEAYLRWESESTDPLLAKLENAFFLFNQLNNSKRALKKAQEVEATIESQLREHVVSPSEARALFRALNIKGRSFLKLGQSENTTKTLQRINSLVQQSKGTQFSYELDLIEECIDAGLALNECRLYLHNAKWGSYDSALFEDRKTKALKRLEKLR